MKIIDAHQHFWDPSRGDYHWLPKDNPILNRKYEVKDLSQVSESIDLHKTILVQAAATRAAVAITSETIAPIKNTHAFITPPTENDLMDNIKTQAPDKQILRLID